MKKLPLLLLCALCFSVVWLTGAQDALADEDETCVAASAKLKFPVKLKTRGKPRRVKWEQLDRVLTDLTEWIEDGACRFRFSEVFTTNRPDLYVPVTNSLVRLVPEASLQGLLVFETSGEKLGEYVGQATYERRGNLQFKKSYRLHYFQFKDFSGELQSTGGRLLLDDYLVRWSDLKGRVAVNTLK